MISYETVTEALNGLKERGFTHDFNLDADTIVCRAKAMSLKPSDFKIVEVYRFEGDTDPADEAVVYGIEAKDGSRGVLVNGYGISSEATSDEMIKKLSVAHE